MQQDIVGTWHSNQTDFLEIKLLLIWEIYSSWDRGQIDKLGTKYVIYQKLATFM